VFESLGGPQLTGAMKVATEDRAGGTPPMRVVGDCMAALQTLSSLALNHDALTLHRGNSRAE
jgi:hypothetical protein